MKRAQILIEDGQYQALKTWARGRDRSVSEAVRMAIMRLLGEPERRKSKDSIDALCGIVRDPGGPSGRDHDRILYGKR